MEFDLFLFVECSLSVCLDYYIYVCGARIHILISECLNLFCDV